jgi:hypothetical protein
MYKYLLYLLVQKKSAVSCQNILVSVVCLKRTILVKCETCGHKKDMCGFLIGRLDTCELTSWFCTSTTMIDLSNLVLIPLNCNPGTICVRG